ncbi:recombinase family protein [Streptomyces sp. DT24]|uniref:recombinase family protein n=1 Tax=unclassified Streptomyces TaxID=2593676 RepID=UPI0023BA245E|nr:recombinase family protein [Streptomyces sp. AM 4-1-1]WEH33612.1 recombinase family protein [Streptomyces sp. AM 4-1-1]
MQSQPNIIERVQRGDLTGLHIAGLVRLSFETHPDRETSGPPMTGGDINNRDEQEAFCRRYVESRGGTYVGTYDEPDTSAWKKKRIKQEDGSYIYRVIRPVFEGMLSDLKKGSTESAHFTPADGFDKTTAVDGSVVYDIDRLTRDHRHLEDAIEVVQYYHRPILDIRGSLDLLTDNGRSAARYVLNARASSSTDTSRRLRDSHLSRAMRGIPVGGNRAFGWAEDKRTIVPREAWQIRAAARLLLAGVKATTIIRKWNKAGKLTTKGNPWRRRTFVLMMTSPRLVGYRVYGPMDQPHHTRYLTDDQGNPVKGQYEAILDEHTWHSVVAILAGPDRPEGHANLGKLVYMLSRIMRCGNCGIKISGGSKGGGKFDYACRANDGGCGKSSGAGLAIDAIVTKLILARLEEQHVEVKSQPWPKTEELATLNVKKANLLAQFKENPDMGSHIWPEVRKKEAAIAVLVKERAAYAKKNAKPKSSNMVEMWPDLEVEQKNAIAAEMFETIILHPASKGSNRFNPERLQVVWRQE